MSADTVARMQRVRDAFKAARDSVNIKRQKSETRHIECSAETAVVVSGEDEQDAVRPDGGITSSRETRQLACVYAAEVCRGEMPTGTALLAYMILFESFLVRGGDETANVMGWDVVERAPVSLAEVKARIKEVLE